MSFPLSACLQQNVPCKTWKNISITISSEYGLCDAYRPFLALFSLRIVSDYNSIYISKTCLPVTL